MVHYLEKKSYGHGLSPPTPSESVCELAEPSVAEASVSDILSRREEAELMRKIDWRVLPMLFVIYVVAFLDR